VKREVGEDRKRGEGGRRERVAYFKDTFPTKFKYSVLQGITGAPT
jgi:hypothetical protein